MAFSLKNDGELNEIYYILYILAKQIYYSVNIRTFYFKIFGVIENYRELRRNNSYKSKT